MVMRKARNAKFLYDENDEMIGVDLGADFVAEHEFGIAHIKEMFGICEVKEKATGNPITKKIKDFFGMKDYEPIFGIEKRAITKLPRELKIRKIKRSKNTYYVLVVDYFNDYEKSLPMELNLNWFAKDVHAEEIGTAWDERGFGIVVDKNHKKDLEMLVKAFNNLDIVIGQAGSMAFKNGGLVIMKKSAFDKESADKVYQQDKGYYDLHVEARNTGIEEKLKKAGKKYYALSPKREDNGEIVFFLNPEEQDIYNYGWFTVKDLEDWAENKGKVIK